jgi:hypothetical protein
MSVFLFNNVFIDMSIQKKLIEDILSSYDIINENKKFIQESSLVKLSSTGYSNLKYDMDGTQNDEVNKPLLDDLNAAAKAAGITATITTAKTGHAKNVAGSKNVSRHMNGTGVDIAILNGIGANGATGPDNGNAQFRELGNKLRDTLVSMGYVSNVESGNAKAVLWQTNTGGNHFNHLHVSNNSGVSSSAPSTTSPVTTDTAASDTASTSSTTTTDAGNQGTGAKEFAKKIGSTLLKTIGVNESFAKSSFGKNIQTRGGKILIPKNSNEKIKSPVSGRTVDILSNSSCINQIVIEFEDGYLEYCGITNPSVNSGQRVGVGTVLGKTNSNVTVTMYSEKKRKESIELDKDKDKDENNKKPKTEPKGEYGKLLVKGYNQLKKSFDKKTDKKLDENIKRIKGLL